MWNCEELLSLYDAVFKRKSVRKYTEEPLSEDVIREAQAALEKVVLPFPNTKIAYQILSDTQVTGKFSTEHASYVAVYAKRETKAYTNAGAVLEQMHLWFASKGIGSWIHGLTSPVAPYNEMNGLPFAFVITFGNAAESVHRTSINEFNRKDFSSVSDVRSIDSFVQTMLLAASGRNRQPWYLHGSADEFHLFTIKDVFPFSKIMPDLWILEGGIAWTHLWLEANHQEKNMTTRFEPCIEPTNKKEVYGFTVRIS